MSSTPISLPMSIGFKAGNQKRLFATLLPIALLLIQVLVFAFLNERFWSLANLFNVMRQSAILLLVSTGSSFVILVGSIDLSVAAVATLSAIATALVLRDHSAGLWALPAAMVLGLAAGAFNPGLHLI